MQKGLDILTTINRHLKEAPQCTHNIKQIVREAMNFDFEGQKALDVCSIQNQKSRVQSAGEPIDIASNRQSTN